MGLHSLKSAAECGGCLLHAHQHPAVQRKLAANCPDCYERCQDAADLLNAVQAANHSQAPAASQHASFTH